MRILVTGAYGFIGKSLCRALSRYYTNVTGAVRFIQSSYHYDKINYVSVGDIALNPNWKNILTDCDCVIHCSARTHIFNETKKNSLETYRLTNVKTTRILAEECVSAGVKRLIFLSSIGVLGVDTNNRKPFLYSDDPNPIENYAISKFEAEKALFKISKNSSLETVIIRSPLVYGPSAPGNLESLIRFINSGAPLPFGRLTNERSFIGIDNLVDLIIRCIEHPDAAGKTFLVSDGEDLSIRKFIKLIASSMGRKTYLFPVPLFFLKILGFIFGKQREINKLARSLRIDSNFTKETLSWTPSIDVEEGIKRMFQSK
jgi:nucleoside-diphosphate-sugar epimerase